MVAGGVCVKVMVCPATVTVPVRKPGPEGLGATLNVTDPLPVVPAGPLTVAHGTLDVEVQVHPEEVVTEMTAVPPDHNTVPGVVTLKLHWPD